MRVLIVLLVAALAACGDREEEEARGLVARVRALDPELPVLDRQALLQQLRDQQLRTERLRAVQATCVDAHGALLDAETKGNEAREALRAAGHTELEGEARAAVERMLSGQEQSIRRAEELLPRCEREVDSLSLRYAGSSPSRRE